MKSTGENCMIQRNETRNVIEHSSITHFSFTSKFIEQTRDLIDSVNSLYSN